MFLSLMLFCIDNKRMSTKWKTVIGDNRKRVNVRRFILVHLRIPIHRVTEGHVTTKCPR